MLIALSLLLLIVSVGLSGWYINDKYAGLIDLAKASGKEVNNAFDLFLLNTREKLGAEQLTTASYLGVIIANLGDLAYELVRRMGVIYFFFAFYAGVKNIGFKTQLSKRLWLVYIVTNIGLLMAYSLYNGFFVSRYTMATALTLLLLCPLVIDRMLDNLKELKRRQRGLVIFTLLLLTLISIEGLDVRTSKAHIKEAGLWAKQKLPQESRIFSNDPLFIYYAGLGSNERLNDAYSNSQLYSHIDKMQINNFDYVALATKPSELNLEQVRQLFSETQGEPAMVVTGVDNRRVYIFKIKNDES
jgi:hypothetical protein